PPLELEIEAARGASETRTAHAMRLTEAGWQVNTRITVTPIHPIDHVDLQLPADYPVPDRRSLSDVIEDLVIEPQTPVARLKFTKRSGPFSVALQALYPVAAGEKRAALELPYPVQTAEVHDQGGQVTISLPEGVELLAPEPGGGTRPGREHTLRSEQAPTRL